MWSRLHEQCVKCGSTEHPHKSKGVCTACYHRALRQPETVEKIVEVPSDDLERFAAALPSLLKDLGATGYVVTYQAGYVTIRKLGTTLKVIWP